MAKWKGEEKVCPFRPQPLQVIIRFEDHLVVVKVFLAALCLQATVKNTHSISFPNKSRMQTCTVIKLPNGNMEMLWENKNLKSKRQCVGAWVLPTWEFSAFSSPISTISHERLSFTPGALLIVEAARIFKLATWPLSYKIFSPSKVEQ